LKKFFIALLLVLAAAVAVLYWQLQQPATQTWLAQKGMEYLQKNYGITASVGSVHIDLPRQITLERLLLPDQHADTLAFIQRLQVNIGLLHLLKRQLLVNQIAITGLVSNITRHKGETRFNYAFLLPPDTAAAQPKPATADTLPIWVRLNKITLHQARIGYKDVPGGQNLQLAFDNLQILTPQLNPNGSQYLIDQILLQNPTVQVALFTPDSLTLAAVPVPKPAPPPPTAEPIQAWLKKLSVSGACITYTNHTQPAAPYRGLDAARVAVTDANLLLTNCWYQPDSLALNIEQFDFAEQSGFVCNRFAAQVSYQPTALRVNQLAFITPLSQIFADARLQFPHTDALTQSPHLVRVNLQLPKLHLHLYDVFTLYPPLAAMNLLQRQNGALQASVNLSGTLANLVISNPSVQLGGNRLSASQITLQNPTHTQQLQFALHNLQAHTGYQALAAVLHPSLAPAQMQPLGNIHATITHAQGSMQHLQTNATVQTDAGNVAADVWVKMGKQMQYAGSVSLHRFEAGKVAQMDSLLGALTLQTTFNLAGTNPATLSGATNVNITQAHLLGYNYQNAQLSAELQPNLYAANLTITDPNIAASIQATANLTQTLPAITTTAQIHHLNTTALGLYKWDFTTGMNIDANLQGNNPDNLNGYVQVTNARFTRNDTTHHLKQLNIDLQQNPLHKNIQLATDVADLQVSGRFETNHLASGIMRFINRYYHAFPDTFSVATPPQQVAFALQTKDIALLQKLFVPQLTLLDSCTITGSINEQQNLLLANVQVKNARYADYLLENLALQADNQSQKIQARLQLDNLHLIADTTETVLPQINLTTQIGADSLLLSVMVKTDSVTTALAFSDLLVKLDNDNIAVQLLGKDLMLNNNTWQVQPDNALTLQPNGISAQNFRLGYGTGKLTLNNKEPGNAQSPLLLQITDFDLADLAQLAAADSLGIAGFVNGNIEVANPLGDVEVNAQLHIDKLAYNQMELGNLALQTQYNKSGKIPVNLALAGNDLNMELSGAYLLNQPNNELDLQLLLHHAQLAAFSPMLQGAVTGLQGNLNGNVNITGAAQTPALKGMMQLQNFAAHLPATNATYQMANLTLNIDPNALNLPPAALTDQTGGTLNLQAQITHQNFDNIRLNFRAHGNNLQLLNTQAGANMPAYGTVNGNLDVRVTGALTNPDVRIFFETGKNTDVYVALPDAGAVEKAQMVTFGSQNPLIDAAMQQKTALAEQKATQQAQSSLNYDVTLKLSATPDARLNIVIDPIAGDQLTCTGEGNMTVETNARGNLTVAGDYTITDGFYQMTLQDVIKRRFLIQKGSNLHFMGDPMASRFDITAIYQIETPVYDMVAEFADQLSEEDITKLKRKQPVQVALSIKGSIAAPLLGFNIILPRLQDEPNPLLERKLAQIRETDTELNKQSFGLIMFNRFIPASSAPTIGTPDAESIVYSSLSKMVSDQLNNLAGKYVKGMEIMVNVDADGGSAGNSNRELQYGVSQQLFNERMTVQVGGTVNLDNQQQNNASLAPDVVVEYRVTKDGKVKARVFRKDRYHQLTQLYRPTTGIGISYKRKFGNIGELFKRSSKPTPR